jgi:hypothetical protein
MSYEGYDEYLCANGHYGAFDVYQDTPKECRCGAAWAWYHSVDQTNGWDESDPVCCDAPKIEIGGDPVPHVDYLGNQYFTCNTRFAPDGPAWNQIAQGTSGSAQDAQRLDPQGAGPLRQDAPQSPQGDDQ